MSWFLPLPDHNCHTCTLQFVEPTLCTGCDDAAVGQNELWVRHNFPDEADAILTLGYPEPGMIAGRYNANGTGHCGIVDYDGWVISAREFGITRNATHMLDGTCGYSVPDQED